MSIKRYITSIILATILIVLGLTFVMHANTVYAQNLASQAASAGFNWGFQSFVDMANELLAIGVNAVLKVASYLLIASGYLLDISIKLTLHIKDFVDSTPAIYTVWQIIRDITGLFFIFFLLYAAIQIIIGSGNVDSYGKLIKNIVVAGILINFSFFITSVGIDASNVVSQAIYNSMVPKSSITITGSTRIEDLANETEGERISNIFMNSLQIQSLYNTQGFKMGTAIGDPFKIILIGVIGVIIMFTTAASFTLAAIAFIARFVILLFLLAFSPIWFVGSIIPKVKDYSTKFTSALYSQLIFMPVYLLLMYVALKIVNDSDLLRAANASSDTLTSVGANWAFPFIVLAVHFTIIIIMLNLPLIAGLSLGGMATDFLKKSTDKFNAYKIWGGVWGGARGVGGTVGAGTIGRMASATDKAWGNTKLGNSYIGRGLRSVTTGALAGSKYGGNKNWEGVEKDNKSISTKNKEIGRKKALHEALRNTTDAKIIGDIISKMTTKEKLSYGPKVLADKNVLKHLKSEDFEAIAKADGSKEGELDFTDFKDEIFKNRSEALKDALNNPAEAKVVEHMIKNMSGKDILKLDPITQMDPKVIKLLTGEKLKAMGDNDINPNVKAHIRDEIERLGNDGHPAWSWVRKNWQNTTP